MKDRDIATEMLKQEKAQIVKKLKEAQDENKRLHARNMVLGNELHKLKQDGGSNKVATVYNLKHK